MVQNASSFGCFEASAENLPQPRVPEAPSLVLEARGFFVRARLWVHKAIDISIYPSIYVSVFLVSARPG